ncbi:MAG: recombinase family protein, partial [Bacteroidota bacterium]
MTSSGANNEKRAAIYARVSTAEQAEGDSLDAQVQACRAYCDRKGLAVASVYREEGVSGTDENRPEFRRMIGEVLSPDPGVDVDHVIVFMTSRFMRNVEKAKLYKRMLHKKGVRVVAARQETEDSASGRLMEGVLEVFDQYESEVNGERTSAALAEAARRGFFPGSRAPFGYRRQSVVDGGRRRHKLVPEKDEAVIVHRLFELYLGGAGAKVVAQRLTKDGHRTRAGRPWTKDGVLRVLEEEAVAGRYLWGKGTRAKRRHGDPIEIAVEPVVTTEVFRRATELREQRDPRRTPGRTSSSPMLLAGLLRCDQCGSAMTLESSGKRRPDGSRYAYANCRRYLREGKAQCAGSRVPVGELDDAILTHLGRELFAPERATQILWRLSRETKQLRTRRSRERARLRKALDQKRQASLRWTEAFEAGEELPRDRYRQLTQEAQQLERQLTELREQPSPSAAHLTAPKTVEAFRARAGRVLAEKGDLARRYIRHLVDRIEVGAGVARLHYRPAALAQLMDAAREEAFNGSGEVLASVGTRLRKQDSNLR